ncbi:MAG: glutaredoxin family protein [Pseudomonadota bacterium]|nr:glutaredoxin family protein [Pseudomonadota bacterium]
MKMLYRYFSFKTALIILIGIYSQAVSAEGLYKWVDKQGNVTYQASPPPGDAVEVEKTTISSDVVDEPEDQTAGEPLPVKFYVKPECPICDQARTYFEEKGIATTEVDITENTAEAELMQKQFGHKNVPTIIIGSKSITGFEKTMVEDILKNAGFTIPEE